MQIKNITQILEEFAPPAYQESYDNSGLIIGTQSDEVTGVLITLDVTEEVVDEAIALGYNLIVSHHPIVMGGIKRLNGKNYVERCVIKAIRNNIAIYACHTNADSVLAGVNGEICKRIGLTNCRILAPKTDTLFKIVTFVPEANADEVRNAIFNAGAGHIGNYDSCSFSINGNGTFRGGENTNPFVGLKGELHTEKEIRIETIFPSHLKGKVISALIKVHPYEEVAYDIYPLANNFESAGSGMYGDLEEPEDELSFLNRIKEVFGCGTIKYTALNNRPIKKVAVCGGAGSFLLGKAKAAGADVFISGDFKYHQYFDAENEILIADIGHFESEQFTKEVFFELLTKKIPNFAIRLSKVNTNPIKYL
ncbi:Nif3-like dinuclear metal center hexameric protein [Plebeiibacterium marinum]|uniref:GTP cyclohydrolase 1 type 2 homolog n=1 Tax=Plebeiibacterium marinum TaxID=2992111 RepID=A0AAE3SJ40_9BACT|nr:Nif3-like dinuclear metal center hexameric protein [Plebeiobacterium marinum]MCW3805029.1 Nif3-like dinuclear metal center hexameric protein [Plebeiobacterium marinum]